MIRPNLIGAVFLRYMQRLHDNEPMPDPFKFDLRDDTTVYFVPKGDRVVVVYGLSFSEQTDRVIAQVLLQVL